MAEREIPNRMTALGLLEQIRRSNANREPEFNPVNASIRERREAPRGSLFAAARPQAALPIPPRPPAVIPPPPPQQAAAQVAVAPQGRQRASNLPVPPTPPELDAEGNPIYIPPAVLPQVAGAERLPMHERFNPENPYVATAIQMAERYGLPRNVFLSVINQESSFRPDAVSPVGARGLGQLMPDTAAELRVNPYNPTENLEGSARYLRSMLDLHKGNMPLALASYNAGPGRVQEAGNTIPNIPETQKYVPTVLRNAGVPGYAHGGLAHLDHKYARGDLVDVPGVAAPIPAFDYHVRANRIRTPRAPRPAPREELTANQLNDMVLDRIAGRAAPAMEAAAATEARDRIGQVMGYSGGGLSVSGGGAETNTGNARILGYSGTAGLNARLGGEGGRLDTSITGQGMSSHAGGRHRQHHRVEGANLNYTTPQGDRFTLGYHDQQMAMPDRLPGADPMEVHRGAPSRGVRLGFSREFAEGGLAELEHKYEGGGPVSLLTGLARRVMRRSPPAPRPDEIPMIAMHNIEPIGLEKIANNGGAAVAPSIGITRADVPFEGFGDISLMALPQTVDPRRAPVYARDAYTPRYPYVIPMSTAGNESEYLRMYNSKTGDTQLIPHTPKNALRVMTNEPWRGGEDLPNYSWLLGQITPQFKNMTELRGARDRLVPYTDTRVDNWNNDLAGLRYEWLNAAPIDTSNSNFRVFDFYEDFMRNMAEAAQRGPGGMEHINRTRYGNAIPEDLLERTRRHLEEGQDLPTTYFEAKPRRIVPLNEFQGAVVPQQASKDVTDLLRRYGVDDIQYYNEGDSADRAAQIRRFERLMFGAAPVAAGAAVASEGEGAPSLDELDQRYAEGGPVMSDAEYDRRLLARMKRDTGRTTESTNAEQAQALRNAGYDAAQLASDIFLPQSPLDAALMVALGPGPRMARLIGSAALAAMEPSEAEAGGLRRAAGRVQRAVTRKVPESQIYPRSDVAPSFKVEPEPGQPFESWMDSLYSPEVRGPDNRIRHPSLMYRGVNDAELEAAIQNRAFRPLSDPALFIENDPTRYTGGGAYGAKNAGAIVQFDVGGLPSVQQSSQRVRGLVEDAVPEIPTDRVTRVWRWNPERQGHYLMPNDEMNEFLRLNRAEGGLADLDQKYAEGGAVSAQPAIYDPDAINALANQIEAGYV
jgi:soluble lytic murein transglycosylase-like protein